MRRLILLGALVLVVAHPALSAAKKPAVVARVGPLTVTQQTFDAYWELLPQARKERLVEQHGEQGAKAAFLDEIVRQKLLYAEALRRGLDQEPIRKAEMELAAEATLTRWLVRNEVERRVVPDRDLRAYYEEHRGDFTEPETVTARHILVTPRKDGQVYNSQGDDATDDESARAKIERIQAELEAGTSFEELARALSEDVSAPKGGELGTFPRGRMVKPFEEAAFALHPGQRSGVVESTYGYHIIEVTDRTPERIPPFDEIRDRIRVVMSRERRDAFSPQFDAFIDELRERFEVESHPELLGGTAAAAEAP